MKVKAGIRSESISLKTLDTSFSGVLFSCPASNRRRANSMTKGVLNTNILATGRTLEPSN